MRTRLLLLLDILVAEAATILAWFARNNFEARLGGLADLIPYLAATAVCSAIVFTLAGTNARIWRYSSGSDAGVLVASALAIVVLTLGATFTFNRLDGIPRGLPLIQVVFISAMLLGTRMTYRLHRERRTRAKFMPRGDNVKSETAVVLFGLNPITELYIKCAAMYARECIAIGGIVLERSREAGRSALGVPVLGTIYDLPRVLSELAVQGVFVERLIVTMRRELLAPDQLDLIERLETAGGLAVEFFADHWMQSNIAAGTLVAPAQVLVQHSRQALKFDELARAVRRPYWGIKRALDVVAALLLLIPVLLVLAPLCLVVPFKLGFPVMFWQYRPGRGGRLIKIIKIRTLLAAHDQFGRRLADHERSTQFGATLRALRLDELPQIFSVLSGAMSFVGPRPLLLSEQSSYPRARLAVRPGLTGWAQVNGGRHLSVDDKLILDLWYINNASLRLDLLILGRTLKTLLSGERVESGAVAAARKELSVNAATG